MPEIFDQLDAMISSMQILIRSNLRNNESLKYDDTEYLTILRREQLNEILTKTYELTEILMK